MRTKFSVLALMLCCLMGCATKNQFQSVDVKTFATMASDPTTIVVDLCNDAEYLFGHIGNAIHLDAQDSDFFDKVCAILPKGSKVALYCYDGTVSSDVASQLTDKGYQCSVLEGGINAWASVDSVMVSEEEDFFATAHGTYIRLYAVKHGSVKAQIGDKWVYVDPVTEGALPETDFSLMPKADLILVTHDHFDHYDSVAIAQLSKEGTVLVTNPATQERYATDGEVMKNGDVKTLFDSWTLEAVPAYNTTPDKQQFHPRGRDNGYILTVDGFRIYFAGDLEVVPELQDVKNIDVAFLPCNLPYTMTPEQLAEAAKIIMPKTLFPYHYGETDMQQVLTLLAGSGIDVRIRQYQ